MYKLMSEEISGAAFEQKKFLSKLWLLGVLVGSLYFLLQTLKLIYTKLKG